MKTTKINISKRRKLPFTQIICNGNSLNLFMGRNWCENEYDKRNNHTYSRTDDGMYFKNYYDENMKLIYSENDLSGVILDERKK